MTKGKRVLTASLLIAGAVATATPPSGPWNVEMQDNLCSLSRQYGADLDKFAVLFQPVFNEKEMELIILAPSDRHEQQTGTATVTRSPDGRTFTGNFVTIAANDGRRLTRITLNRVLFDELAETDTLKIKAGKTDVNIAIVRFVKAAPVFHKCESDLLVSWGVDPDSLAAGRAASSHEDFAKYFKWQDYPPAALKEGNVGGVKAVLNIDSAGKVTNCRPVVSAGKLLNEATCTRARLIPFIPGKDANGIPAASIFILNIHWSIE